MQTFFPLIYEIKSELVSNFQSSIVYMFINYFIMLLNHLHNYLLISSSRGQNQSYILSFIEQIDITTSFFEISYLLNIEIIIFFSIVITITLLFFFILQKKIAGKKDSVSSSTLGYTFIRSIRIIYWVLCYPFLLTASYSLLQQDQVYQGFCFAIALFVFLLYFFHDAFLLNDQYQKKDFLNIANSKPLIITNWIKIFQCILSCSFYYSPDQEIIYLIVSLGLSLANYIQLQWFLITFGKFDTDNAFHLVNCLYVGLSIGGLIQCISNFHDPYSFILIVVILMLLIIHLSLREYLLKHNLINSNDIQIKLQLLSWLREFYSANVFYTGTIINHYHHANNKKCFLRHSAVYYSGKKLAQYQYITTKTHNLLKHQGLFIKFLKKCLIETELVKFPKKVEIRLIYAEILFYQFNLINESYRQVQKIATLMTLNQNLRIYCLQILINKKLKEFNFLSFKSKLPFEGMLRSEELMKDFSMSFLKILEFQTRFWKSQLSTVITIKEQISINQSILTEIQLCQQNWKIVSSGNFNDEGSTMLIRFRWRFLYFFFKLYVLHKKLKVSEIKELPDYNLRSSQILQDEKIDERSSSDDEGANKLYYITNSIVADKTLFFRVDKDGEIIQTSHSILKVLGLPSHYYRGARVESLMPTIIKENHNSFLKQFYKTGQSENLYKRRSIQIKHSKGYCIKVQKYLKYIFNLEHNRFEFMSMMRPVSSRSQYLLMNSLWEIDSMSEYLYSLIGDNRYQFLSLCPKAISYSDYSQFLTSYDMRILSLKLCSFGSRERIQDKKFTFRRQQDQTFSNKNINDITSLVFKKELEEKQKKSVIQLFQQVLDEDNDIETRSKITKLSHIKCNIRIPLYKTEMLSDYQKYENEVKMSYYQGEQIRRVVCRNTSGKLRLNRDEFLYRYRWIKQYRLKLRYQKIKLLFETYCQERILDKVLKVDANIKFYKTLNNLAFLVFKINRLEIYDEHTCNEKQDIEFPNYSNNLAFVTSVLQEIPVAQNLTQQTTAKNQSGFQYSDFDLNSNRELISHPFLAEYTLREDFQLSGSDCIYSLHEQHNLFMKEESNKLHKFNHKLKALLVTDRTSFFLQIFLITLTFFLCQFYYNPRTTHDSVTLLSHLYNFSLIAIESYNYLLDVALMNEGKLTSLLISNHMTKFNTTEQFYSFLQKELEVIQIYMYDIYYNPDFVGSVYSGFYNDDLQISGIDIMDFYQVDQTLFYESHKEHLDFHSEILEDYRSYMIPYFEELLKDSVDQLVNIGIQYQSSSTSNLIIFMIIQIGLFIIALFSSLILKIRFRTDVNIIFSLVARIPLEDKTRAVHQQQSLFYKLHSLIEEEQMGIKVRNTTNQTKNDALMYQDSEEKNIEKLNKKKEKTIIKPLPHINLFNLIGFVIYGTLLLTMYFFAYYLLLINQTETQEFFQNNCYIQQTPYFWLITLLKEQFIHNNYLNQLFSPQLLNQRYQDFLDDINGIEPQIYKTTIYEIQQTFDNSLCDQDIDETGTYIYFRQYCSRILDGSLSRGLKSFNLLFQRRIIKSINPDDDRYDPLEIDELSEYQISFQIIYLVFLNNKNIWVEKAKEILASNLSLSFICFIVQLFTIIIIYTCFIELYLHKRLKKDFYYSKQYYKHFMLNTTINQEKTMRVELVKAGLLQK